MNGSWTYKYDEFNRATSAVSAAGSSWAAGLTLTWGYDRYGNRLSQSASGNSSIAVSQPNIATTGNRIVAYCYDGAGRLLDQGGCQATHTFNYDAEGRLRATGTSSYVYDAEGERAAKLVSGTATAEYLHDAAGNQTAEFNGSYSIVHVNAYLGSKLIATNVAGSGISYAYADWLGTKRYQTSSSGTYQNSWGSLPFGDTLTALGSGTDATENHMTGKERDAESGLDYFGARYYSSTMGRWMSPDWSAQAEPVPYAKMANPQTLNLYAYVGNQPLGQTDSDGHDVAGPNDAQPIGSGGPDLLQDDDHNSGLAAFHEAVAFLQAAVQNAAQAQQQSAPASGTENGVTSQMNENFKALMTSDSMYSAVNIMAGYSDAFTMGATKWANHKLGDDTQIDHKSKLYISGAVTGAAVGIYVAGAPKGGKLFGTRFGGNTPLLNGNDTLRIGWSYIRASGQYVFRIGGTAVGLIKANPHINLYPPSWWFK